jgi:hypothetical protein
MGGTLQSEERSVERSTTSSLLRQDDIGVIPEYVLGIVPKRKNNWVPISFDPVGTVRFSGQFTLDGFDVRSPKTQAVVPQ